MRRSMMGNSTWVFSEKKELMGIALGSDACSEHEWGVAPLRRGFRTNEELDGIERRKIRIVPEELRLVEYENGLGLFLSPLKYHYRQPEGKGGWMDTELRPYRDQTLVCAWDEKSFGIAAYSDQDKANLREMYEAFKRLDVAFWTNIGVFHTGGGLIFGIVSRIPEENKQAMLDKDLDVKKLKAAAEETGIAKELEEAGKRWFALSPHWSKSIRGAEEGPDKTSYPVVFWLNPMDQHKYQHGYWTVEQLRLWAKDTGPVMRTR